MPETIQVRVETDTGGRVLGVERNLAPPRLGDGLCTCTHDDEPCETCLVAVALSSGKQLRQIGPQDRRAADRSLEPEMSGLAAYLLDDDKVLVGCHGVCAFV